MKILLIGATGMLGQAIYSGAVDRGYETIGCARSKSDISLNICDDSAIEAIISRIKPEVVINAAAITNVDYCESEKCEAYLVNARAAGVISQCCLANAAYFVQISTDHYYVDEEHCKHMEDERITLVNEYARSKYLGERLTMINSDALVVRTNIVGLRGDANMPTFLEWMLSVIQNDEKITLYEDFYTSSVHVNQLSRILFDLLPLKRAGLINIASRNVFSKKDFYLALINKAGYSDKTNYTIGSVKDIVGVRRANSIGLNVELIEQILGYEMPRLEQVIDECFVRRDNAGLRI